MSWDISTLYRSHAGGTARALRRAGLNPDVADDLTQDAFLRVLARPVPQTNGAYNPRAYLYRIAHRLGINHRRREALVQMVALGEDDLASQAPTTDQALHARQCLDQAALALAELPDRTRRAFVMHRIEERSMAEIGQILGISTSRAWGLIREAYRHLAERVDER
ncbi:RNA polymerase sigma factor [Paracoccus shanxieyensis]|uniref:RNA polymerase sigma factor n=1 Tax=Paracoccus shanxieyensis TaxID=2675752 RepID=A0A6L6J1A1_9RHOB|nr:sigma-70 family RNA polymerase sigma factor [Paracoccus shanxieyensis]MTH65691.1 sigma-70 family RNA polymerase sigma factor [Paracoccus shanxieyensis]MTH88734.1 sigma-70 family RNA polymerase sigma factor [Paracoccus shanxieyensis]